MMNHYRRKIDIIQYVERDNSDNIDFNDKAKMRDTLKQKLRNEFIHRYCPISMIKH